MIQQYVQNELSCSAHNIDHTMRVHNLCIILSKDENVDLDVIKASALFCWGE